jgi:serine protease Do
MLDPVRAKAKVIGVTAASFLGGVLIATGMDWTAGSHAATFFQAGPSAQEVRPIAELTEGFISIAESVTPAVVSIRTERAVRPRRGAGPDDVPEPFRQFFQIPPGGQAPPREAGGTGFIISADGYILTNNHVVQDADQITVVMLDRREFRAEIVGRDPTTDVAVIRIDGRGLPVVRTGNPQETRVGEWVLAIGNPLGLDFTVTAGIVSAKGRDIRIIGQSLRGEEQLAGYAVESFIQTDAAINPGNSGGPLVNIRGEVVGVNSAIASETGLSQGYGFAIPIDLASRVADDLIRYGRVRRAILGVQIQDVTVEDAEVFRLPTVAGAVVQQFSMPNAPAERAGLRQGDVIVAVNGMPVNRINELQRLIASQRPGDRVTLEVVRYGDRLSIAVPLAEVPGAEPATTASAPPPVTTTNGRLGLRVAPLTGERAQSLGYSSPGGVVIDELEQFGPLGRRAPDVQGWKIVRADGQAIADVAQFERLLRDKPAGGVISLVLQRPDGTERIVNVRVPS